jgi:peptidoglycan hydrolase-like protein with peptidoglycan-binding domain
MKRTRTSMFWAAALAIASGIALTPALVPATPASAAAFCDSTSLVAGTDNVGAVLLRVPTVGTGTGDDNCNLEVGDSSTAVARLQIALNSFCNLSAGLQVDGNYGPLTQQAVRNVQSHYNVHVDGEYGPVTGKAMFWPTPGGFNCGRINQINS